MTTPQTPQKFYRLPEVAEHLGGLNIETVRRMCNTGELRAVKAGNGPTSPWLVRGDWIDEWAERNTYNPAV